MKDFRKGLLDIHDAYKCQLDIIAKEVYKSNDADIWKDFMLFLKVVSKSEDLILRCVQMNYKKKFEEE